MQKVQGTTPFKTHDMPAPLGASAMALALALANRRGAGIQLRSCLGK
ncbi:hypothetical protein [Pseudomonas syringae]|nr:hypothetical protein [Pseudomonas syringae]